MSKILTTHTINHSPNQNLPSFSWKHLSAVLWPLARVKTTLSIFSISLLVNLNSKKKTLWKVYKRISFPHAWRPKLLQSFLLMIVENILLGDDVGDTCTPSPTGPWSVHGNLGWTGWLLCTLSTAAEMLLHYYTTHKMFQGEHTYAYEPFLFTDVNITGVCGNSSCTQIIGTEESFHIRSDTLSLSSWQQPMQELETDRN